VSTPDLRVVLATRNAAKLAELRRIVQATLDQPAAAGSGRRLMVIGLADVPPFHEPPETEPTFAGNALLKARAARQATGLTALADDSGLCVDALNGMPGVLSARWAGAARSDAANNALLLDQLHDIPDLRRGAHFAAAVALCTADGVEHVTHGKMPGTVLRAPRGSGGFGYDPLFVPDGSPGRTSAELRPEEKDALSHRGAALHAMVPTLLDLLTTS